MRRICEYIGKAISCAGADGMLHLAVSALLMVALGWMRPLWIAVLLVLTTGIGKECYDYISGKGTAEFKDIICDCFGILLGLLLVLLNSLG